MSIERTIADAVSEAIQPEAVQEIIKPQIDKMITESLGKLFGYNGQVRKVIESALEDQIKIHANRIDFTSYNKMIMAAVKSAIDHKQNEAISAMCDAELSEIFKDPPKEICASELIKLWVDQYPEERLGEDYDDLDEFYELSDIDGHDIKTHFVLRLLDKRLKEHLSIQVSNGKIISVRIASWSGDHRDSSRPSFSIGLYNVERDVFKMYAAETKIINDI